MEQARNGVITLRDEDATLGIAPAVGGSIVSYTFRGKDIFRASTPAIATALEGACFPLVPFANRIAFGTFSWRGRDIRLKRNFGDHPHVLHGKGWQAPWRVASQMPVRAALRYDHAADDWPWPFSAGQIFELKAGALDIHLSITNAGSEWMPVSLGFHPFFPRLPSTRLTASVRGVWLSDDTQIPTRLVEATHFLDLAHGVAVAHAPFVDNCHSGWNGSAVIDQPELGLRIRFSASSTFLHVFTPLGANYFCVEPVTAMPDAVHRSEPSETTGLHTLEPGATFSLSMTLVPEELR
jgi:aldose 1-epimerase